MFLACASVGRWWWIMCLLCLELQACSVFFHLLLVSPRPSFVLLLFRVPRMQHFFFVACCTLPFPLCFFVSTTPSAQCYFFLLHLPLPAPLPLCFWCSKFHVCNIFFLLCVAPTPPSSMFFVSKFPSTQHILFSTSCCTCPPLFFEFFVSKPLTHNIFCFLLCVAPAPPSFVFFGPNLQACNMFVSIACCTCPFLLCFLCPEFQMHSTFFFCYVLHPAPLLLCFFVSKVPSA